MSSPDIVLVVLDTVRAQSLSLYGHDRPTTPFLEQLAGSSVVYDRAYAPSCWTAPSHATLFTGLEPSAHRVGGEQASLDSVAEPTLAERLSDAGYRTAGVSSNPWIGPAFGFERGFERFTCGWKLMQSGVDVASESITQGGQPVSEKLRMALRGGPRTAFATAPNYAFARWRRTGRFAPGRLASTLLRHRRELESGQPFFGFLNLLDAHLPYIAPRSTRSLVGVPDGWQQVPQKAWPYVGGTQPMTEEDFEVLRRLYDAEIRYLDNVLRTFVERLDATGRQTLLVITSDHGENIGEHQLMDHQFSLHDTLIRIPMLVRHPDGAGAGTRRDELVGLADVHESMLRAAGTIAAGQALPGPFGGPRRAAIVSDYLRPQPPVSRLAERFPDGDFTRCDRTLRALVRDDGAKVIWASNGAHEHYDLSSDPWELRSLYDSAASARLIGELEAAFGAAGDETPSAAPSSTEDDEVRAALESLGYL